MNLKKHIHGCLVKYTSSADGVYKYVCMCVFVGVWARGTQWAYFDDNFLYFTYSVNTLGKKIDIMGVSGYGRIIQGTPTMYKGTKFWDVKNFIFNFDSILKQMSIKNHTSMLIT